MGDGERWREDPVISCADAVALGDLAVFDGESFYHQSAAAQM
jgi:hypothetical protein